MTPNNLFERYTLKSPSLLPKPVDIPDDYIAYNPSSIWTTRSKSGEYHDIMYVRVEPDRSNPNSSRLSKSRVKPYIVDVKNFNKPLIPYQEAQEKMGEDAALTRINWRMSKGIIEKIWLLSCVDAQPFPDKPDCVKSLRTKFYFGSKLNNLIHFADGPEWMKDIRIVQSQLGSTALHIYGRPQPKEYSGNITHTTISGIEKLNAQVIAEAPFIDEKLLPIGSGMWGGVNDVINIDTDNHILVAHRAWRTGENGNARHYEAVLYGHNTREKTIVDLGVLATANMFPAGTVKANEAVDLHDVVFSGGGYNGTLQYATFGVRDGSIGISQCTKANR